MFNIKHVLSKIYLALVIQNDITTDKRKHLLLRVGVNTNFICRFIFMCEKLMDMTDVFVENFLDAFMSLAKDKVDNVRISVAKVLKKKWKDESKS